MEYAVHSRATPYRSQRKDFAAHAPGKPMCQGHKSDRLAERGRHCNVTCYGHFQEFDHPPNNFAIMSDAQALAEFDRAMESADGFFRNGTARCKAGAKCGDWTEAHSNLYSHPEDHPCFLVQEAEQRGFAVTTTIERIAAIDGSVFVHQVPRAGVSLDERVQQLTSIIELPLDPLDVAVAASSPVPVQPFPLMNESVIGQKRPRDDLEAIERPPKILRVADRMRQWRQTKLTDSMRMGRVCARPGTRMKHKRT